MLKTVLTMWRLVFGFKGKNNKRRRRSKEREEKEIKEKKKEKYVCEGRKKKRAVTKWEFI
jgi:hypothetical protein